MDCKTEQNLKKCNCSYEPCPRAVSPMTESAPMTARLNILHGWWPITGFRLNDTGLILFFYPSLKDQQA